MRFTSTARNAGGVVQVLADSRAGNTLMTTATHTRMHVLNRGLCVLSELKLFEAPTAVCRDHAVSKAGYEDDDLDCTDLERLLHRARLLLRIRNGVAIARQQS